MNHLMSTTIRTVTSKLTLNSMKSCLALIISFYLSYHNTQTSSAFTKTFRSFDRLCRIPMHAYCITADVFELYCTCISCDTNMSGDHIAEPATWPAVCFDVAGIES